MSKAIHEVTVVIKESHLDTFGHINNATYLTLFEQARWDLITENGYGLDLIRKSGLGPTILEINIKFQKEVRNRQLVKIRTRLDYYKEKVGQLTQEMLNEKDEICCQAIFTFGLFDVKQRKLVPPTVEWAKSLGIDA